MCMYSIEVALDYKTQLEVTSRLMRTRSLELTYARTTQCAWICMHVFQIASLDSNQSLNMSLMKHTAFCRADKLNCVLAWCRCQHLQKVSVEVSRSRPQKGRIVHKTENLRFYWGILGYKGEQWRPHMWFFLAQYASPLVMHSSTSSIRAKIIMPGMDIAMSLGHSEKFSE